MTSHQNGQDPKDQDQIEETASGSESSESEVSTGITMKAAIAYAVCIELVVALFRLAGCGD